MFIKIHNSYRDVIAICDSNLIGKKFEQNNLQLDIIEDFYKGEEKTPEEIKQIIQKAIEKDSIFNIVGEDSVALAIEIGLIDKENVKKIQGIPLALSLL